MPIDIDPTADPERLRPVPAKAARRRPAVPGARPRPATPRSTPAYHDRLDELLETPVASTVELVEWPEAGREHGPERSAPVPAAPGL
jgi:hypothetical protein